MIAVVSSDKIPHSHDTAADPFCFARSDRALAGEAGPQSRNLGLQGARVGQEAGIPGNPIGKHLPRVGESERER